MGKSDDDSRSTELLRLSGGEELAHRTKSTPSLVRVTFETTGLLKIFRFTIAAQFLRLTTSTLEGLSMCSGFITPRRTENRGPRNRGRIWNARVSRQMC